MYDPEALIQDADIELAEMAEVAAAIEHWRLRGICQHQHAQHTATGTVCRENTAGCTAAFASPELWWEAMDRAAEGTAWAASSAEQDRHDVVPGQTR